MRHSEAEVRLNIGLGEAFMSEQLRGNILRPVARPEMETDAEHQTDAATGALLDGSHSGWWLLLCQPAGNRDPSRQTVFLRCLP
jgi:hypothetical protein